jgi:hypothetical protein
MKLQMVHGILFKVNIIFDIVVILCGNRNMYFEHIEKKKNFFHDNNIWLVDGNNNYSYDLLCIINIYIMEQVRNTFFLYINIICYSTMCKRAHSFYFCKYNKL